MNLVEFMKKVLGIKLTVYQKEILKFCKRQIFLRIF